MFRHAATAACVLSAAMVAAGADAPAPAPGYSELSFPAPVAGTYSLPPLGAAGDGIVLDTNSRSLQLQDLFGDRIVVLSFIYRSCSDVNGCPLATHVLGKVQAALRKDNALNERVRLISLSFDPLHDTPDVMRAYARHHAQPGDDWHFLTTSGEDALAPLLETFDQAVNRDANAEGAPTGTISHVLRVFLVDDKRQVRNIYSSSFLHADTLLSDIRTLAAEGS